MGELFYIFLSGAHPKFLEKKNRFKMSKDGFFHVKISFYEAKFRKLGGGHKISLSGGRGTFEKRIKVADGDT